MMTARMSDQDGCAEMIDACECKEWSQNPLDPQEEHHSTCENQPLRCWDDGNDKIVAYSAVDARRVQRGYSDALDASPIDDWTEVPGDKIQAIYVDGDTTIRPIEKTIDEWIKENGRGLLCSHDF